jgi:hypothetical protein
MIDMMLAYVYTNIVDVNGLGLTFHVSVKLCKFILCHVNQCKCKNEYIYIIFNNPIKQCIYIYNFTLLCKTV